jgi:hypothetical protein
MKKTLLATVTLSAAMAAASLPVQAQFSMPGGLGGKSGNAAKGDPAAVERDLRTIIAATSKSVSMFFAVLSMKEEADKLMANAECIEKNSCGVKDGVDTLNTLSQQAGEIIAKKKTAGDKLDAEASARAVEAALPGLQAMPTWKKVIDAGKSLDSSSALSAGGLVRALPLVPGAAKGSIDFWKTTIDYLSFSGASTGALTESLNKGMAGI